MYSFKKVFNQYVIVKDLDEAKPKQLIHRGLILHTHASHMFKPGRVVAYITNGAAPLYSKNHQIRLLTTKHIIGILDPDKSTAESYKFANGNLCDKFVILKDSESGANKHFPHRGVVIRSFSSLPYKPKRTVVFQPIHAFRLYTNNKDIKVMNCQFIIGALDVKHSTPDDND